MAMRQAEGVLTPSISSGHGNHPMRGACVFDGVRRVSVLATPICSRSTRV